MKISEYQKRSYIAIREHKDIEDRISNWAVGLAEEVGEVMNHVKHGLWGGEEINKQEIAKELGDVLWYASALATTLDIDLGAVAELNILKLETRFGGVYDEQGSLNRVEKEKEMLESNEYKEIESRIIKK